MIFSDTYFKLQNLTTFANKKISDPDPAKSFKIKLSLLKSVASVRPPESVNFFEYILTEGK
jgi:hypothetical protein